LDQGKDLLKNIILDKDQVKSYKSINENIHDSLREERQKAIRLENKLPNQDISKEAEELTGIKHKAKRKNKLDNFRSSVNLANLNTEPNLNHLSKLAEESTNRIIKSLSKMLINDMKKLKT